ncbi:entericidin A/B family lipoprotein [Jannaschia sp. CCS1]|nr:entericidin A/B family lipoprotein [Jannaschia sp. CCS1]
MTRMLILLTAVLGLSACETIGGVGEDVSTAGQAITATAQDVEDELD